MNLFKAKSLFLLFYEEKKLWLNVMIHRDTVRKPLKSELTVMQFMFKIKVYNFMILIYYRM